jgi:ribonuclease P protein component
MTDRFTFRKTEKLSNIRQIGRLYQEGHSFVSGPLRVNYLFCPDSEDQGVQVLIAIPKKRFRRAVHRNRLRRLIREAYRLHKQPLTNLMADFPGAFLIGFTYLGDRIDITFDEIEKKISEVLPKLESLIKSMRDKSLFPPAL